MGKANRSTQERFQRYSRKYQSSDSVAAYDTHLFKTLKGKIFTSAERRALRKAFAHMEPGQNVLDVPCGTGRITEMILDLGFKTVGADISEEMLGAAREKLGGHPNLVDLCRADSLHLDFDDDAFGAVVSVRYLADIPVEYQKRVLAEMSRITRDVVVAAFSGDSRVNRSRRKLKSWVGSTMSDFPVSPATLKRWADACGLKIVAEYHPIRFLSEELIVVFRKGVKISV